MVEEEEGLKKVGTGTKTPSGGIRTDDACELDCVMMVGGWRGQSGRKGVRVRVNIEEQQSKKEKVF